MRVTETINDRYLVSADSKKPPRDFMKSATPSRSVSGYVSSPPGGTGRRDRDDYARSAVFSFFRRGS